MDQAGRHVHPKQVGSVSMSYRLSEFQGTEGRREREGADGRSRGNHAYIVPAQRMKVLRWMCSMVSMSSCLPSLSRNNILVFFPRVFLLQTQVNCLLLWLSKPCCSSVLVQSTTSSRPEPSIPTNLPRQFLVSRPLSPEWQTKMDMLLFLWLIVLGVMIVFAFAGILILMIPIIDPERAAQNANR